MDFITTAPLIHHLGGQMNLGHTVIFQGETYRSGELRKLINKVMPAGAGSRIYVDRGAMGQDAYVLSEHTINGEKMWASHPQEYSENFEEDFARVAN